jgi:transcription antitermination factor NusG
MLKETLLLDSTRPLSDAPNKHIGCPEHSSEGVPSSWYALRVSYSRELKVQKALDALGVKTFVPMMWKRCPVKPGMTKPGMTKLATTTSAVNSDRKLVPAVGNLCFAYSTRAALEDFIRGYGEASPVHFYWDRTANRALTVPDKAMNDFITVASTLDEDIVYVTEISAKLREGQTVMVKDGPFKGVEGKVVRIRKSRRILVELPGMLAVATTYIDPVNLEII